MQAAVKMSRRSRGKNLREKKKSRKKQERAFTGRGGQSVGKFVVPLTGKSLCRGASSPLEESAETQGEKDKLTLQSIQKKKQAKMKSPCHHSRKSCQCAPLFQTTF